VAEKHINQSRGDKMKKRFTAGLVLFIVMISVACGNRSSSSAASAGEEPQVTFNMNNPVAGVGTLQDKCVDEVIARLTVKSAGRIKGTKITSGVLGSEREVAEAIQLNTVDVAHISDMGIDVVVGKMGWAWLPFLVTNEADADKYYNNGWIGDGLTKQMSDSGIIRLAGTENGFRVVGNAQRPIKAVKDLQGMKIRVPEIPELLRFYEMNGSLPVAIAPSEVLTALEQKTIDGVDNSVYNHKALGVLDSFKYITETNHMYSSGSIVASKIFWDKISAADQALFYEAAKEASEIFRKGWREQTKSLLEDGIAKGTFVVDRLTPELESSLKINAVKLWNEFSSKYAPEYMDKIKKEFGGLN
jgi:TRAP-type C4-dicarboxylate transport system substrate-binding protein